jgi:hypothetical protein
MGQQNNSKRNASLDDHKRRAAGRQQNKPEIDAIRTWRGPDTERKATGGAHGRAGKANRSAGIRGSGGGTGVEGLALDVNRSSRRTRKKSLMGKSAR